MQFTPTPEQQQLGEMVQRFLNEQYGFETRRKILASEAGWSREVWSKLGELGLLALQVPEAQGGSLIGGITGHFPGDVPRRAKIARRRIKPARPRQ